MKDVLAEYRRAAEVVDRVIAEEQAPTSWPDPEPLLKKPSPQPYPVAALPRVNRDAVLEAEKIIRPPLPLLAAGALSVASIAVQGLVDVRRAPGLVGPTSLFLLVLADSGERKSTVDGWFMQPLRDWQAAQELAMAPDLARWRADLAAWEAEVEGVKQAIRQAAKAGKSTGEKRDELRELEAGKPPRPLVPALTVEDATSEALAWRLAHIWPSMGLVSAEAGAVLGGHAMGRDNAMRTLSLLNKLWSGEESRIDRRGSESFTLRGARLTLALQVQPDVFAAFLSSNGPLARGSGFLARALICHPESTQGKRLFVTPPATAPAREKFGAAVSALLEQGLPFDQGTLAPAALEMSDAAHRLWVEFHDEVERGLAPGGELSAVRDVASKAAEQAARLAAIFHVIEQGAEGLITVESLERAVAVAGWHLLEARRVFGEQDLPAEVKAAQKLETWLLANHDGRKVPLQRIRQYGPSAVRRKDDLWAALELLADHGRIIISDDRPTFIELNPALTEGRSNEH